MIIQQIDAVLRVADVAKSIEWYQTTLGFKGDPFPDKPPYAFAILRSEIVELMLRCSQETAHRQRKQYDWDLYLRVENTPLRELFAEFSKHGIVSRRLERMFYGPAEFEITDPDGYTICLSQMLDDASDLPTPTG